MSTKIPCYLALTGAEFAKLKTPPPKCAYMACHFSCYGTGLSNLPDELPSETMLILNDRTPVYQHDPEKILSQVLTLVDRHCISSVLLDFQRPGFDLTQKIGEVLTQTLPCPVAISLPYAEGLSCPIFLPPPPLHMPLRNYIEPYSNREVWLDLAVETAMYIINKEGCVTASAENIPLPDPVHFDQEAFCRYHIALEDDRAVFTLQRTEQDIEQILLSDIGIVKAVGLWGELKNVPVC